MAEQAQAALERRVAQLVEARRDQLAELVRAAVDQELEQLVDAELRQRSNGPARAANGARHVKEPSLRRCNKCARDLAASKFEKHRHVCRECRQQQARDRERDAGGAERPRPAPGAQTA